MSVTDNKDVVRRLMGTYESHDLEAFWKLCAPNCRFAVLDRFGIEPTLDNKAFMTTFLNAFPDVHHHIEHLVADGFRVWALYTVTGTHHGSLRGDRAHGQAGALRHRGHVQLC